MTKPNFTAIALVVDESGSMDNVRTDTIGGINTFIRDQKALAGDATLTLVKFNERTRYMWDFLDLKEIKEFNKKDYAPAGNTALYDAVGLTIDTLGVRLSAMPECDRPSTVVIAILTDGIENFSRMYTNENIADMIKHQTEVYSWQFLFLGANQDAILSAGKMNIAAGSSMTYTGTASGTRGAYKTLSNSVLRGRTVSAKGGVGAMNFTEQDKQDYQASVDPNATPTQTP